MSDSLNKFIHKGDKYEIYYSYFEIIFYKERY